VILLLACAAPPEVYLVPQPVLVEVESSGGSTTEPELVTATTGLGPEGYILDVERKTVRITAEGPAGHFYGQQTLTQLGHTPPRLHIEDAPLYSWRGSMIDVARHFFSVDDLKDHVELMALHKLNRLHLHLTDDQGWRLEILSWPLLTEIGGSTQVGGGDGGFYTQDEYRDLVAFAAERFITVVPEVDMPGHCNAALASYGELNPSGQPTELYTGTNVGFSSFMNDEGTLEFVDDVLGEVAGMTPGAWIHVGADEAHETSDEEYRAFLQAVQPMLTTRGKTLVGWDEVVAAELSEPFVLQWWRSAENAAAAQQIIASPAEHAYLDMAYDEDSEVGAFWAGFTDLEDAYIWEVVPPGATSEQVVGLEAPLWTELPETWDEAEYLIWPRLAGHAELAWSGSQGWEDYSARLHHHLPRLDERDVAYADEI
jgi:hexosaminidase